MQNAEPYSTREATERLVKIIDGAYAKDELDNVCAAAVQIDKFQHKRLLSLLTEFEDLFDGTLVELDTTSI